VLISVNACPNLLSRLRKNSLLLFRRLGNASGLVNMSQETRVVFRF